jgi:two-component system OmpR family sensor kinase
VRASIDPDRPNRVLVIASSLKDVLGTLHRLLAIELIATLAVLAGLVAAGLWVVRVGLRPLAEMTATAATIAGGDLSKRVARADDRTEVGRLGAALNTMLGQIERAFHAQRASEDRLRRFVADASHELRTPLAAVRAYAELFSRGAAQRPDDLRRSMDGITRESERMSKLVEDLLLLARLDEGPALQQELVDLSDVVVEAVETAHTLEPSRSIDTRLEPAEVIGDHDRLRQVLDNLFANVRAHTDPHASVRIALETSDGAAHLTFSDTGPGMPPDAAAQIFERFYRADPSRARTAGGAGLGLSIVEAVVDAHGGTIEARSRAGEGTSFEITLPLAQDALSL